MAPSMKIAGLVLLCALSAVSAAPRRALRASTTLAADLEAMRLRMLSTGVSAEPQSTRTLKTVYAAPGSYGYGYYSYGYYSTGANAYPMRRSLLGEVSSGRSLLQAFPYATGGYYGYYGYYSAYGGAAPYSSMAMRRLSSVERLTELLSDSADGFVTPGSEQAAARRALLQSMPYPTPGYYGYYGYGGYGGYASAPYAMAM